MNPARLALLALALSFAPAALGAENSAPAFVTVRGDQLDGLLHSIEFSQCKLSPGYLDALGLSAGRRSP